KLNELIKSTHSETNKIVMYESTNSANDLNSMQVKTGSNIRERCYLLIGPEGGFSINEINLLQNNHWKISSLGERKLRAETAAIVSVFNILIKN
nr:RNA methyltransferase [Ignavibacteria bacterium]